MFTPRLNPPVGYPTDRMPYRVVVALPHHPSRVQMVRLLRECGCIVWMADSVTEARRLARDRNAHAVVLAWQYDDESGPLTCQKMKCGNPRLTVVLVGPDHAKNRRFAEFVGAAHFVGEREDVGAIVRAVVGPHPAETT